ncbi:hypothetical protein NQ318_020482 [Aromia moschata]|uniref:Uncharacterized protein n=1 Tax=Aromia moschata TaxID=1265417 RepID=A0AAV8YIS7_9CUCU|nr:hypothetical protein NQ318_020482 [Aromia moschata]
MGMLWRKRSLLLKLVVIVGTAWFTIAFLLYTDDGSTRNGIAVPAEGGGGGGGVKVRAVDSLAERVERVMPFVEGPSAQLAEPKKREDNNGFIPPPQNSPGEMGKPVVLPANLSE